MSTKEGPRKSAKRYCRKERSFLPKRTWQKGEDQGRLLKKVVPELISTNGPEVARWSSG